MSILFNLGIIIITQNINQFFLKKKQRKKKKEHNKCIPI